MVIVVLPAYNEEAALPALLAAIREALAAYDPAYRVIVVDDGSSDNTAQVAQEAAPAIPVTVIRHSGNRGLGAAINTGLRAALDAGGPADVIVAMDADNTHPPSLIPRMVEEIRRGCGVVIASRYCPGGREVGLAFHRRLLSRCASALLRACFPIPGARDYTCGYRAYAPAALRQAIGVWGDGLIEESGFACMAELLVKLGAVGVRVGEAPLVLRYDLKAGPSKMRIARTIKRYWHLIARRRQIRAAAQGAGAAGGRP